MCLLKSQTLCEIIWFIPFPFFVYHFVCGCWFFTLFGSMYPSAQASLLAQMVKNLPTMQKTLI